MYPLNLYRDYYRIDGLVKVEGQVIYYFFSWHKDGKHVLVGVYEVE